jgi:hypothetical protein
MNTLKELKEKAIKNTKIFKVETEFVILDINEDRKKQFVVCYKCGYKETISDPTKFIDTCPKCGTTRKDNPRATFDINVPADITDYTETVKLDLWRDEVTKYKVGDIIKLTNGSGVYRIFKDKEGKIIYENLFLKRTQYGHMEKLN